MEQLGMGDETAVPGTTSDAPPSPLRLLLIEDYEDDAVLVVRALRRGGFAPDATVIENILQLNEALDEGSWDVVITDYMLPDFTGLKALQIIRDRGLDIPLIVVSGAIGEDVAVASMRAGAHDYVMKDNLARLAEAVRRELGEAEVRRARRDAEAALRRSEARYRAIVEDQTDLVVRWRPDGTRTFVNRAYCSYFDSTREALLGGSVFEHVATADRPAVRAKIARLTPAQPVATDEHRVIHPGGHIAWHECVDRAIFDAQEQLIELQSVARDVTARRRVAEVERQQLLLVEVLRDTAAILSSTLDLDEAFDRILGNIRWVIPHDTGAVFFVDDREVTVARQRGWRDRGILDLPTRFTLDDDESATVAQLVANGKPISIRNFASDSRLRRAPAQLGWIRSVALAPLFDETGVRGVLGLFSATSDHFTPTHMELLEGFASHALAATRNARLFQAVSEGRRELQALSAQVVEAQEDERRRISRELHDEVGQTLTVMIMSADFIVEQFVDRCPQQVLDRLAEMSDMARRVLEQIRGLSHRLRPGMLDELGLIPTLHWLIDRYSERSGIEVRLQTDSNAVDDERLGAAVETALYRAVQEALTNAGRHSQASLISVVIGRNAQGIDLMIEDNGQGFQAPVSGGAGSSGLGLVGMRERINRLGGELEIVSSEGEGTRIEIHIPLPVDEVTADESP